MYPGYRDPVPADKMMSLLIVQAITAFYMGDYNTGVHYIQEIKTEYASSMSQLSPTMKKIARDIISALDLLTPSDQEFMQSKSQGQQIQSESTQTSKEESVDEVRHKLEDILKRRRQQRGGI